MTSGDEKTSGGRRNQDGRRIDYDLRVGMARTKRGDLLARIAVVGPEGAVFRCVRCGEDLSALLDHVAQAVEVDGIARVWLHLPLRLR